MFACDNCNQLLPNEAHYCKRCGVNIKPRAAVCAEQIEVEQQVNLQLKTVMTLLGIMCLSFLVGGVIYLGTAALLTSVKAARLPGGAVGAGLMHAQLYAGWKSLSKWRYLSFLLCPAAAVAGHFCFVSWGL